MSTKKKTPNNGDDSISRKIADRVKEIKSSKSYDPRREQELNEMYRRYIPPHSMTETSHLVDVAERDAYVDPFPPIASNKKAGVFIKKGIRAGFGWYAQFLSQQISTFGSGVTRALRSISNDVEDLKRKAASAKIPDFVYSLNLSNVDKDIFTEIAGTVLSLEDLNRIIVSDSIDNAFLDDLSKNTSHLIVVDPRADAYEKLEANVDSRKQEIGEFLSGLEDATVDLLVLNGIIGFFDLNDRLEIFAKASRVLNQSGTLVFVGLTSKTGMSTDEKVANEVFNSNILSTATYEKIFAQYFTDVKSTTPDKSAHSIFYCKNSPSDSQS